VAFADADFHTLEFGLHEVSEATGGFYVRTNLFSQTAIRVVESSPSHRGEPASLFFSTRPCYRIATRSNRCGAVPPRVDQ
jgi:hypothetical protein